MEIILKNVGYRYKNKKILEKINLKIRSEMITGITGDNKTLFIELINAITEPSYGEIKIGNKVLNEENLTELRRAVCFIRQKPTEQFFTTCVKEEMEFLISRLNYKNKNIEKKMKDALQVVGLKDDYLEKEIFKLSSGEQKLIQIAVSLLYNPSVIIFDEPFVELDYQNKKKLIKLIKMLKERYHKTIIIASNDSNLLYELTDDLVIIKKTRVIAADTTTKIYQDVRFLEYNDIEIPNLVLFTDKARKKKVKLNFHKDIRDLIKDVYKHV
ncbi:MAG: ABC transporter ATP-binding protein [Firmicutes bacterium]|nr:ABC transporter ATP-binding protein [Bacillota bacterium]